MEIWKKESLLLLLPLWILFAGVIQGKSLSYDYTASIEAQYGGGIIKNPELNEGLRGWLTFGNAIIQHRNDSNGNEFVVARKRSQSHDAVSQKLCLENNKLYTFSAWVQVSEGESEVRAVFKTVTGLKRAASTVARSRCWSMLKGGLTVNASGPAELFFDSHNTSVEIWVDSVSLQPFTHEEWNSHHVEHIEKTKRRVRIRVDAQGKPVANSKISIKQKISGKPVGCATNKNILSNVGYQNWFTSRFSHTTFEDEMKWYSNEPTQGREDYSVSDSMMALIKQHNIAVRGHNILWDDPQYQPSWVPSLGPNDLSAAATKRVNSIMTKYKGQVIGWDVVNENLHFNFLESKLGPTASSTFYKMASDIDSSVPLFMNEYNTLEEKGDTAVTPDKYLAKLKEIQSVLGVKANQMAIGLECHFDVPDLPYVRSSLDTLAATKLPIWLTEIDVKSNPKQATFLEQVLREGHGHPGVSGMVIWAAWKPEGCYHMCLTDNNFNNLATGDVVDKLLKEWGITATLQGQTDAHGFFEVSLLHGEYEVKISLPVDAANTSLSHRFKVEPAHESQDQAMIVQVST
ncbi:putative Glycosyl hydrolase family 10 protein [Hibiscus syriacus]|uniref:Glycosyl hydrolase family 10 protein n=1 Tax=Hibiscus syriacus TaxID=106335 RepID=A0A6A3BDQ6_HIBSY|nr:putative Glycosyl hydrolase family 10 protein [Hibiscus syriacus]